MRSKESSFQCNQGKFFPVHPRKVLSSAIKESSFQCTQGKFFPVQSRKVLSSAPKESSFQCTQGKLFPVHPRKALSSAPKESSFQCTQGKLFPVHPRKALSSAPKESSFKCTQGKLFPVHPRKALSSAPKAEKCSRSTWSLSLDMRPDSTAFINHLIHSTFRRYASVIKPHQIVMCNIPDITCNCSILLGNLRKHSLNTTNNVCKNIDFLQYFSSYNPAFENKLINISLTYDVGFFIYIYLLV